MTFIKRLSVFLYVMLCGVMAAMAQNPQDVTGYQTLHVTIPATAYNADAGGTGLGTPRMPAVKYNKTYPLIISSDDMGKTELTNNWAAVNGYPCIIDSIDLGIQPGSTCFLQMPYKKYYTQGKSQNVNDYTPMTFTDNVGKTHRYIITSAIMPKSLQASNYAKINGNDIRLMRRTGWSFAQHDVESIEGGIAGITALLTSESQLWQDSLGMGLKVLFEPNGNHDYLAAAQSSPAMCWSFFQNNTSEYPMNSMAISDWTNNGRTDWSASGIGNLPSTFSNKPTGGYRRFFFQGKEETWKTEIQNANNTTIRCGGTHGLEDVIKTFISTEPNVKNNAWVAGADEVWEYYHIYNKLKISNVSWDDTNNQLSFDVDVPTYNKSMYRELTLNIPGLTGGTAPTITGQTVYTGGYQQTADSSIGYTMNIGLEGAIQNYINELLTIYRDDQTNLFVKRDIQYLINQLWNGTSYQSQLDAAPTYQYVINASLGANGVDGTVGLVTGKTDTNGTRRHALPRYVFSNGKLYETAANNVRPYYVTSVASSTPAHSISYTEKDITSLTVANSGVTPSAVAFIEGEDMTGVTVVGNDYDVTTSSDGRYYAMANGSGGMIGNVVTGYPATVTTSLPRGKYKMVIGYAEAAKGSTTYSYNVNVDGTSVYSFNNSTVTNQTVTEITSDEFTITGGNTVTISTDNPDATINNSKGARGIDYVFIVRTGSLEPVNPGAELTTPVTSDMLVGKTATLNATTHLNGGTITSTAIYAATTEGTPTGNALATSATTEVSYNFTPSEAGSYYFVSQSVTNIGTTTSSLVTITAVAALSDFTLNIVDKSGNVAMTTTVSNTGSTDPLPNSFRSPFAQNYKYYNTLAEAQANSGANITAAADWIQGTVYVGYDVNSTAFGADKKYAIYNASNYYMHAVFRCNESHTYNNLWWMRDQNNDCSQGGGTAVSATTQAFLDDSYTWYLGTDPYNVKMCNVGSKRYVTQESTNNYGQMEHLVTSDAGITSFCVVYYENNNTDYLALYNRTLNNYVYYNGGYWRIDPRRNEGKLKVCQLPALNINVVNAFGNVEYTLNGYYKSGAALTTTVPLFLKRTYTSNQRFYYDAACTSQITQNGSTAVTEGSLLQIDGIYNVWMKYDLSNDWDTDNIFRVSNDNAKYWYAVRFGNNNYLNAGTTGNHDIGSAGNNSETSTTADNSHWAITGTPYALRLINRDSNNSGLLAGLSNNLSTSSSTKASMYNPATEGVTTTWEMRTFNTSAAGPVLIPLGSFSGQTPFFFLYASDTSLNNSDNTNCRISQYDHKATTLSGPPTVTLAASTAATYTGSAVTLTATPTLGGGSSLSNLKFYKKVGEGEWTEIQDIAVSTPTSSTAYAKEFTPDVTGTYTFKATTTDDNNDTGTSETVTVTVTAPPAHSTVTLTASSASPTVGSTVTLTATATPVSGSTVTYLAIEQKINNVWTVVGDAYTTANGPSHSPLRKVSSLNNETGEVTVTYDLTARAAGTDYEYRANATISDGVNTPATLLSSDAAASGGDGQSLSLRSVVPTPEYDTYKFHIIDNAGTDVFSTATITISKTDLQNDLNNGDDPLLTHYPQYCSPFVSNYLYFDTSAEAQANSGNATAWNNSSNWDSTNSVYDVYVGYTIDATKMGTDKSHAIWANSNYLHVNQNAGNAKNAPTGAFESGINSQYDVVNPKSYSTGPYVQNGNISPTTLPFIDNTYMWELGTDPYNIKLKNKAYGLYHNSTGSSSSYLGDNEANAVTYCLLYWASYDWTGVDTSVDYYRLMYRADFSTDITTAKTLCNWSNYFRVNRDANNNWAGRAKMYISTLPAVNLNVLNEDNEVECTLQYYFKSGATMPGSAADGYTPFNLYRSYTSKHQWYYDAAATDAITYGSTVDASKISSNPNIYVKYTLDSKWGTSDVFYLYPTISGTAHWYAVKFNNDNNNKYLIASTTAGEPSPQTYENALTSYDSSHDEYYWAFSGTPYNLKLINKRHGDDVFLGVTKTNTQNQARTYLLADTQANNVTWEMVDGLSFNNTAPYIRLQKSFNGEIDNNKYPLYLRRNWQDTYAPILYYGTDGDVQLKFTEMTTTTIAAPSTVTLSVSNSNPVVDANITFTAVATPSDNTVNTVTSLTIEEKNSSDGWDVIATSTTADAETGVITLNYVYAPQSEGEHIFRAHAVIDGNDQYSTDEVRKGGDGSELVITARPYTLDPLNDYYTLVLIDKQGHALMAENNVPKARVTATASSGRNGDPLADAWRSPLVTRYDYYSTVADAQSNTGQNQYDWNTATDTTVYVGYAVGNTIDLNTGLTNIYERVSRSNDDTTKVRNAAHFGTMYMLKFHNGVNDYLENGKDAVETTTKKPVYPYANGDGQMYIYDAARWIEQSNGGNSTRTRWAWYLLSPTNDPYHVYVTAWQQSHANSSNNTSYYNFLRTYYNTTINQLVTTTISDDPKVTDTKITGGAATNVPSEYMLLGTTGHYKLVTSDAVSGATADATYGAHQTVKTLEQYWKNNPTASTILNEANKGVGSQKVDYTLSSDQKDVLEAKQWHTYQSWANAAPWDDSSTGSKTFDYGWHWYKTFDMGDGTFDLEPTEIDAVLVLVDNHGWEVMRQPIAKYKEADKYAAVKAILKQYDSPMVQEYRFYASKAVDHKVSGYHKYRINDNTEKALTESQRVNGETVFTSLADYPEKYSGGALTDLYVTYVVKPAYANSYTGAATEAGTSASKFIVRQGTKYAQASVASIVSADAADSSDDTFMWYLKPNFNIDTEMGYRYNVDVNGKNEGMDGFISPVLNELQTNTNYYTYNRQGFDPYNLRIQNVSTGTYFTTNATAYSDYAYSATYPSGGGQVTLTDASTVVNAGGYEVNEELNISNATFMAVQDSNGNMRLMPRFDIDHVIDNFSTLAAPAAAQPVNDESHSQTTLFSVPMTYHIINNAGKEVLVTSVANATSLEVPDNIKSPWVSAYYYHTDSLHAATAATRTTSNVSGFPSDVYVSYTVDAAKMAVGKEYAIFSGVDSVFMHPVFRETQSHSGNNYLAYRYNINKDQKYDEEYDNDMPSNLISAKNLPFVDNTYMWSLGDDPYNIQIVNNHIDSWKYIKQNPNVAAATGDASLERTSETASTFCLLYWNGDTSSDFLTLRYVEPSSETNKYITDASQRYMIYDNGHDRGRWVHGYSLGSDSAKMVIKELPDLNVNVVNAAGMVEYTLQGHYVEGAKVPGFTPYFLKRSYTSGHTYYYDSACESQMTAGAAIDSNSFDGSNIYVRYNLDASWNTEDLFLVSDTENKHWYNLYYSGKGEYLYANANNNINGISDGTDQTSHFAIYGTPYALRMENRANSGYYIGIPTVATTSTDAKVYNSFDNIISTWELSAYVKTGANKIGNLANVPFIRPQGSISRETPLLYLRPNTGNKALADTDSKENRVTFVNALRLHLIIIDKAGNQKLDDYVSGNDIDTRNGDPLSNSLRSPYAKNYKYFTALADAQANSGSSEVTGVSALQGYLDGTLYVGYDVITTDNAQQGETPLKMDGATPYRIRKNADNSQVWHATFSPSQAYNSYSNYGWLLINQTKDYSDNSASTVNYNTLPFIDRSWAWEMVSEDGDPYNVKFRNQANGLYVSSENSSTTNYKAIFTSDAANASVFSLLYQNDTKPKYLALYEGNRQKYVYYDNNDGGRWCLDDKRKATNNGSGNIHISELTVPLDINIVRPAGYDDAGEVEAVIHGYRNNSVGANMMQSFVPYYLTRAYVSDQKFYYTKAAAAAAAENTEVASGATINDNSITDGNSDGVLDMYVSYTLDGTNWLASASPLSSEDKTANASIIKPVTSSDNGMANWYAIRSYNNDNNYFRAYSNDLPAALTRTGSAIDNSSIGIEGNGTTASAAAFTNATAIESDYMRRAEWAFIGTPYSLRLIERKHGMMGYLGMTDDATNSSRAYVYATGTDDVVTTFEMVTGLNNITERMFIRPQGSLNGQTPYLYLGGNDNNMLLSPGADASHSLEFTWVTEAEVETTQPVTIQLYDANGNLVMTHESDMVTGTTLSSGTLPASMLRQFCTYTMYSSRDSETGVLSNEIADITIDEPKTVYVQWGYSDNAPVFCQGTDTTQYQYYSMRKDLSGLLIMRNTNGSYEVGVTSNTDEIANRMTQWALVGNPYDLKVFSRGLHQYVSLTAYNTSDNNTFAFVQDMAQADSWQMPLYHDRDNDGTDDVDDYCYYLELKEHTGMYYGQSKLSATRIELRSQHLMLPVNVYRNGEKIDTCEIIIDLFRSLSDRIPQNAITLITEDMLGTNDYLAQTDGRRNYRNPLWMHAFCNYTYYNDSELTIRVPESGLSVFGGAEQRLRALHATYMVDDEQFSQVYLLDFINNNEHHYIGKASNAITLDAVSTRETARSKESRLYKWVFVGDPYDLRITNQETGENITLASRNVSTGSTHPSVDNGLTFQLTEDTVTNKNYRWEMIDCGDGKVKFYMLPNTNVANRYESGITGYSGTIPLFVRTGLTQYPMHLDNVYAQDCILDYAYPQYNLVWTVVDPNTKQVVAQMRKEHVVENRVIRSEDMPDALRRHFLEYNTMYANQPVTAVAVGGTAVYENSDLVPNNTYTVSTALPDGTTPTEDTDIYLYMPYTYDSGAPDFLDATPDGSTGERYWYEIHFPGNNKYLYYKDGILSHSNRSVENIRNSQADLSSDGVNYVPYDCYRWALVGNPYSVKFYNKSTGSYLTTDGTALSLTAEGTVFDLMDDASGDLCDILDEVTGVYVNCTAGVQKSNYYYGTSAEFTNTNGVVRIKFVLHYSDNTMRKYDSNNDNTLDASSAGTTEIITVDTYQKLGKNIIDVLPTAWKRAFCDYSFHWDASTTLETTTQATVTTVDQNMVDAYNERRTNPDPYLDVHVTYNYETNAPFKWSTPTTDRTGKYWYYMVNNHARSGNSGGKMIFRDSGANLRISRDLKDDELYLNNFEWCVIGDPYGFKLLNRYDPDQRYDEYISETSLVDASSGCNMFEQDPGNPKNIYEMMPGLYSENFWLHPIYSTEMLDETDTDINYNRYEGYSYMGQNYNGSAAIKQLALMKKMRSNASANYRLEVRSDATLKEYMDYAGFVGALKYDIANDDAMTIGEDVVDVSAIKTALDNDNATDEQKRIVHELINDPDNIEQMTQGYYRLIPYTWEYNNSERRYVRGYLDANEKSKSGGMNDNMKVETEALAEYDPASILWFERTSVHDNDIDRDFPRYYVKTQGLDLAGNSLSDYSENDYKCRYEDLGASIMQLKTSDTASREYLSCAGGDETSTNHCFDEQAGRYKTRFYLQKVGSANENELPYRKSCSFANGTAFEDNDYYYTSFYVPYDILLPEGAKAYIGREENRKEEDDYRLRCYSVDWYYDGEGYSDYQELDNRFVPGGVPVVVKYEKSKIGNDDGFNDTDNSFPVTLPNNAPTAIPDAMKGKHEDATNGQNNLHGSYLTDYVTGLNAEQMVYVFTKSNKGNIGFFFNNNTLPDGVTPSATYNSNTYILHNRIYYIYTPGGPLTSKPVIIQFMDEEPGIDTDIETIDVNGANGGQRFNIDDDGWYTLHGVRLKEKPSQRGVYIYKGRKVVVK